MKIVPIILFLFLISCKSDKNPIIRYDNSILMPLAVGNKWEYEITFTNPDTSFKKTIIEEINGKIKINNNGNTIDVFLSQLFFTNSSFAKTMLRNEIDGLYRYGVLTQTDTLISKSLFLKYPTNVGENWPTEIFRIHLDGTLSISDTLQIECRAKDYKFETLIGDYNCYVYHYQIISEFGKTLPHLNMISYCPDSPFVTSWGDNHTYILDISLYYKSGIGRVGAYVTEGFIGQQQSTTLEKLKSHQIYN